MIQNGQNEHGGDNMTTQHTAGPWHIDECNDADGNLTVRVDDGTPNGDIEQEPVATVYTEANAQLIAAAPELLAAAEQLATILEVQGDELADAQIAHVPELNELRAAIAKARGEA